MNLDKLLQGLEVQSTVGQLDRSVGSVVTDHRKIQTGSVWVCYRGVLIDAHQLIRWLDDPRPEMNRNALLINQEGLFRIKRPF